ncbi:MAG TPA: DNA N-6-adenine-methyltransferase [Polyangia bacterium]|jgi:hypothetical protein|nr:DNA N-6-adenine-methyltransferase [Polyangia bacterium]
MPAQKPHRSEQTVCTPREFLDAVEKRFGEIGFDLAAEKGNQVTRRPHTAAFFGPGSSLAENALDSVCIWPNRGLSWLNPPFANIRAWARRCYEETVSTHGSRGRILLLVPAAVGSVWFNSFVRPRAFVFELSPRLTFVGHKSPYPKDLILAYYGPEGFVGRAAWRWK